MNLLKIFIYKLTLFYLLIVFNLVFVSWAQAQVYAPGQGYTTISAREMQISQTQALLNYLAQNLAARMLDDDLDGEPEADHAAINNEDGDQRTGIPLNRSGGIIDPGNHTRDVWGQRIKYCAWNNGTTSTATGGLLQGNAIAGVYIALISAGPDGAFSQTCAGIWNPAGGLTNPDTRSKSDDIHVIYTKDRLAFNATAQAFRTAVASRNDFVSLASAHQVASANGTFENRLDANEVRLLRFENGVNGWERRLYVRNDGRASTSNIGVDGFDPLTPMVDPYGNLIGGGSPTSNLVIRSNFNESNTASANTGRIEFQTASSGMASNSYVTRLSIDQFGNINTMSNGISSALVSAFSEGFAVGNKFSSTGYAYTPGLGLASNASALRSLGVLTDIAGNGNAAAIFSLANVNGNIYRGWDFVSASQGQFYLQPIGVNGNYMGIASSSSLASGGAFLFYASGTASAAVFQTNNDFSAIRLAANNNKYLDMSYDGTASKFMIRMNDISVPIFELNASGNGVASFNVGDLILNYSSIRSSSSGLMLSPDRSFSNGLWIGAGKVMVYKDFQVIGDDGATTKLTLASNGNIVFQDTSYLNSSASTLTYSGNLFKLNQARLYNDHSSNLTLQGDNASFTASTLSAGVSVETPLISINNIASISAASGSGSPFWLNYKGINAINVYRDSLDGVIMQMGNFNQTRNPPVKIIATASNSIRYLDFSANYFQIRNKASSNVRAAFFIPEGDNYTQLHLGDSTKYLEWNSSTPNILKWSGSGFSFGTRGSTLMATADGLEYGSRGVLADAKTGSLLAGRIGLWCSDPASAPAQDCSVVVYGDTNAPRNATTGSMLWDRRDTYRTVYFESVVPSSVPIAFNVQGNTLSTTFMIPSDRRLKQSIHALRPESSYTEFFRKINPVSWQWKKDGSHGIGFIAQELIGAGLGDLVKVINNPDLKEEIDANGIKSPAGKQFIVDYDGMTAFLAGAQIESIKRLDRLEKLMNAGASSELRKAIETQSLLLNTQGKDLLAAMSRVEALEKSLAKVQTQSVATDARFNEFGIVIEGQKKSQEKFQLEIDSLTKDVQKWEDKLKESRGKVDKFMHFFEIAFDADALKDKSRLVVKVPEMKVNNLTAERIEAAAIRTQMLEAEAARIKQLEADQITAQDARLGRVYSGSKEVQSLDSTVLFELPADGQHFVVTVSGPGVYYTATVIRVDGVTHVTPLSASPNLQNPDIELIGEGPRLRVNAAGRAVKASWVRMG